MEKKFEFKPFDKVLVRDNNEDKWEVSFYGYYDDDLGIYCAVGEYWCQCIPFEGNEHLLGTTDDYTEHYVPKDGDFVYMDSAFSHISIYKRTEGDGIVVYAEIIGGDLCSHDSIATCINTVIDTRPATEEEKQLLLSKLAEIGKKWNPEKKCIEDVWTPEDGDFVYVKSILTGAEYVFIKKVYDGCSRTSHCVLYDVEENALSQVYETCCLDKDIEEIRPATDSEKQQLLDALHKDGKDWDQEKKEIVEYKWRPKEDERFFYVDGSMIATFAYWDDSSSSCKAMFTIGNCFRTREEALAMADKFKKLLKGGKE